MKVGIIGTSGIAKVHIGAFKELGVKVVGIFGDSERAKKFGLKVFSEYSELLKEVDVVDIVSRNDLHVEQALEAVKEGKKVIVEKPIGISLGKVDELKGDVSVVYQRREDSAVKKVKELIGKGKLGKIVNCGAYLRWCRDQNYYDANGGWRKDKSKCGGGALIAQTIHLVDLLQFLVGDVKSVLGEKKVVNHDIEVEDRASAVLKFKNGASGFLVGTTALKYNAPDRIEIFGEKGYAIIEGRSLEVQIGNPSIKNKVFSLLKREKYGTHLDHLKKVLDGEGVGVEEAKKSLEIVLGIYDSAEKGSEVFLDEQKEVKDSEEKS